MADSGFLAFFFLLTMLQGPEKLFCRLDCDEGRDVKRWREVFGLKDIFRGEVFWKDVQNTNENGVMGRGIKGWQQTTTFPVCFCLPLDLKFDSKAF